MRAVVQRAISARVIVDNAVVGEIDRPGLVVFVGVTHSDTASQAGSLAAKVHTLRIFAGERSAADIDAPLLVVSQFTLYADTRKGRRPSWNLAAPGAAAAPLVDAVVAELHQRGATVATGVFGADMRVDVENDGPMTLIIDVD